MTRRRIFTALLLVLFMTAGFVAGHASAAQPHMQSALNKLRSAKRDLAKATDDKGGHRAKALSLVDEAIEQVEKGIRYDRRN